MANAKLDNRSVISKTKDVIARDIEGETILLSLDSGVYYSLDNAGTSAWRLIDGEKNIADIAAAIVQEYDVDPATAEADLLELIHDLANEKLVEVKKP